MNTAMERQLPWLLATNEPALRYQIERDLLGASADRLNELQGVIPTQGWAKFLQDQQRTDGVWGREAYGPKWTCTHYVTYELLQLGFPCGHPRIAKALATLLAYPLGANGGVNYAHTVAYSDVCVNGSLLAIAAYFANQDPKVDAIVGFLLHTQLADGGWNTAYREGEMRGSMHSTIVVLEGLWRYRQATALGVLPAARTAGLTARVTMELARGLEFLFANQLVASYMI